MEEKTRKLASSGCSHKSSGSERGPIAKSN